MEELLKVNDISMVFGGLRAVSNFSMTINKGELIGLIGPNGAGKKRQKILSGNAAGHGAYFPEYPPVFRAFRY